MTFQYYERQNFWSVLQRWSNPPCLLKIQHVIQITLSCWVLNSSRDEDSTTSLGNLFEWLTAFTVKKSRVGGSCTWFFFLSHLDRICLISVCVLCLLPSHWVPMKKAWLLPHYFPSSRTYTHWSDTHWAAFSSSGWTAPALSVSPGTTAWKGCAQFAFSHYMCLRRAVRHCG